MSVVNKSDSYWLFTIIAHVQWQKMTSFPKSWYIVFLIFSKLDRVKTMGTRGKICRYLWIWIANKFAKLHAKRLSQSENIPNVLWWLRCSETPCRLAGGIMFSTCPFACPFVCYQLVNSILRKRMQIDINLPGFNCMNGRIRGQEVKV